MDAVEKVREITTGMVESYDERIGAVEEIIEKSLKMLDQNRFAEQLVHGRFKETLARVESLRKKDFDSLTAPLLTHQGKREVDLRLLLSTFLKRQRELASQLKRMIMAGRLEEIPYVEKEIHESIEEVRRNILSFQREQMVIEERMRRLSQREDHLTLREFKEALDLLHAELGLKYGNGSRNAVERG